ncbi:acyl-CoA dehydrogenase family protein [Ureibacillus chungkukjangi]|uniref:Alkylation response protein AidB-like acyl-CoA dehydrogenase n=1 Tax=Ureibacillus chungkukjangi TaxID=1202712 RepID=A0A318U8X5_9BACL|nr:acyl-CoA dehydrogenase family protein [Ureibacillus chungkukjangi]PYF08459.1 alkylation response protein AidB-like acyl-CoA dehydrogenase [Ureibacillus chungkukjangi]
MNLPTVQFTKEQELFREEVRTFLQQELQKGTFQTKCDSWLSGSDPAFSRIIAEQGWIGMTWPKEYGGAERSSIDRYILTEEFLAIGAPVAAHWFADRQTGPLLLRFGTDYQKNFFLPKIVKGECFFAIGLSEPNSGSDLASVKTKAEKVEGGWIVNGAKTWTSNAQDAHYMVTLVRTEPVTEKKHQGLSQLIINLKSEGVTITPIRYLTGEHHFNDVFFDNVFVPDEMVVGTLGNGWAQGLAELAYERSGPERILSTFPLLNEAMEELKRQQDIEGLAQISKLVAELWSLRNLSIGVAKVLEEGGEVGVSAALVKSVGTKFEQKIPEIVRLLLDVYPQLHADRAVDRYLAESTLHAPGFTIRGGTSEVLYGIIAKGVLAG